MYQEIDKEGIEEEQEKEDKDGSLAYRLRLDPGQ